MSGMPKSIHLDNAPEFHSKALARGCAQFGIELIYRPPGRPHFGGHVERSIGTLMSRFKTLPGATGASTKDRKLRRSEKTATMTLAELERWLVIEFAERYHHRQHRGLEGATPYAAWDARAPALLDAARRKALSWAFLPAVDRKVRRDGVHFNHIHYWHPLFSQWAVAGANVLVHYDPRDLSKVFVRGEGNQLLEVGYADTTKPAVSLWECNAAVAHLRKLGIHRIGQTKLFVAIEQQREIVRRAAAKTRAARAKQARLPKARAETGIPGPEATLRLEEEPTDERKLADDQGYTGEIWP